MSQKLIEIAEANSSDGVRVNYGEDSFEIFPKTKGFRYYSVKDYLYFKGFLKGQDIVNPRAKCAIGFWFDR